MFAVNDIVLYNRTEVFCIQEMREMICLGERSNYYVLKPVYEDSQGNSIVYVPVNADESRVCRMISEGELRTMLQDRNLKAHWYDGALIRKKEYTELINRNRPQELIGLIRTLHERKTMQNAIGRKFSEADEKYLVMAERKLYPLFRYILGVSQEEFMEMVV